MSKSPELVKKEILKLCSWDPAGDAFCMICHSGLSKGARWKLIKWVDGLKRVDRYFSEAEWPNGMVSTDEHTNLSAALCVVERLKRDGMGLMNEVYPVRTKAYVLWSLKCTKS